MPDLFDIHGQDAALAELSRMLGGSRRPQAYIFAGPEGVGRRTTAEALAKILLCHQPGRDPNAGRLKGLDDAALLTLACGQCPSCRTFEAGTHGDYQLVYKELARYSSDPRVRTRVMQDLGIDVIREFLIDAAQRHSSQGGGRVFVIREAELMNTAAQNALLKTLEEPPPRVTIILLCGSPGELLPTIRSRCGLVRFGPLPREFVVERLTAAGTGEAEARFWAGYTDGSLGQSLRLAGGELYPFKRELVERLAGLVEQVDPDLGDWLAAAAEKRADALVAADKQLAKTLATRRASETLLGLIAGTYRDAMVLAAGRGEGLVHSDQPDCIVRIAEALGLDRCTDVVSQLAEYARLLWSNLNAKIIWDNVVISCATGATLDV